MVGKTVSAVRRRIWAGLETPSLWPAATPTTSSPPFVSPSLDFGVAGEGRLKFESTNGKGQQHIETARTFIAIDRNGALKRHRLIPSLLDMVVDDACCECTLFIGIATCVALAVGPTLVRTLRTMDFGTLVLSAKLHAHAEHGP